jgi:hypothetical protein
MKTLPGIRNYLLLTSILWAFGLIVSHAQKQASSDNGGRVELSNQSAHLAGGEAESYPYIKIHPPVKLSPADEKDLTEKLKNFDQNFYKLVVLTDGRVDKERSIGTLKLSKEMDAELANAQAKGLSVFAPEFIPCGMQAAPAAVFRERSGEMKQLMNTVGPILSKYQTPNGQH